MTEQEVINALKSDAEFLVDHGVCDAEEIKIAIQAVEKQIAKKPITNSKHYCCDACGIISSIKQKHNYCHNCGQKLDWSDEE